MGQSDAWDIATLPADGSLSRRVLLLLICIVQLLSTFEIAIVPLDSNMQQFLPSSQPLDDRRVPGDVLAELPSDLIAVRIFRITKARVSSVVVLDT